MPPRFAAAAAKLSAAVDRHYGEAATYTPPGGGASTACTAIVDRREPAADLHDGRPLAGMVTIKLRKSEIAEPQHGGLITVDGGSTVYTIVGRPKLDDGIGVTWTTLAK